MIPRQSEKKEDKKTEQNAPSKEQLKSGSSPQKHAQTNKTTQVKNTVIVDVSDSKPLTHNQELENKKELMIQNVPKNVGTPKDEQEKKQVVERHRHNLKTSKKMVENSSPNNPEKIHMGQNVVSDQVVSSETREIRGKFKNDVRFLNDFLIF